MSSTEPPSRIPPRGHSHESKSAREEISSKGKVEKVREVDADETRKRRFQKYMEESAEQETEARPTPFDLVSGKEKPALGNVEEAIVPSPSYTPPPAVNSFPTPEEGEEDEATAGALPKSEDFWEDLDFPPEQPTRPSQMKEAAKGKVEVGKKPKKEEKAAPFVAAKPPGIKKEEPSPFGPPGKPGKEIGAAAPARPEKQPQKLPSPFEETPKARALEKDEKKILGEEVPRKPLKKTAAEKAKEEAEAMPPGASPAKLEEREGERGRERGREQKAVEIISHLPPFPAEVQPMATSATTQATPYLSPQTINLFFQMVGTMYVMTAPPGIARTEIILNNPAYAGSRFFGATITIEKYATAPDSFNIRLTGTNEAVVAFRENIPSLMTAFQNGNFTFRVNRIDAEYTIERPVFRRRDKGEKGEAGGGDLGERRK